MQQSTYGWKQNVEHCYFKEWRVVAVGNDVKKK